MLWRRHDHERSPLSIARAQADLAGRDFAAQRGDTVVVSTGAVPTALDQQRSAVKRKEAEQRNSHRSCTFFTTASRLEARLSSAENVHCHLRIYSAAMGHFAIGSLLTYSIHADLRYQTG